MAVCLVTKLTAKTNNKNLSLLGALRIGSFVAGATIHNGTSSYNSNAQWDIYNSDGELVTSLEGQESYTAVADGYIVIHNKYTPTKLYMPNAEPITYECQLADFIYTKGLQKLHCSRANGIGGDISLLSNLPVLDTFSMSTKTTGYINVLLDEYIKAGRTSGTLILQQYSYAKVYIEEGGSKISGAGTTCTLTWVNRKAKLVFSSNDVVYLANYTQEEIAEFVNAGKTVREFTL